MAGDMESEESYSLDQVYTAAKKATDDLKLHMITGEGGKDALSAAIVARDAADKRITIKLTSTTQNTTRISIRIGTFGSETKSRLIYSKIMENLRATAQAPAAPAAQPAQTPPEPAAAQPAQTAPTPPATQEPAQTPLPPPATQEPAPTPPAPK